MVDKDERKPRKPQADGDEANAVAEDDPQKVEKLTKAGRSEIDPDEGSD